MTVTSTYLYRALGGQSGLWRLDATTGETHLVADISAGELHPVSGGRAVFVASDVEHGIELWVSDGTTGGTHLLKDIFPGNLLATGGPAWGDPRYLTPLSDGRVMFMGNDKEHGYELWITDGSAGGTYMVKDILPGTEWQFVQGLTDLGDGRASFIAKNSDDQLAIWVSDGTDAGTFQVTQAESMTDITFEQVRAFGNGRALYETAAGELWITDGTEAGTRIFKAPWNSGQDQPLDLNLLQGPDGRLIVGVGGTSDGDTPRTVWVTDGTEAGTHRLFELAGLDEWVGETVNLGNGQTLLRGGVEEANSLWITDGTAGGTVRLDGHWTGLPYQSFMPVGEGKAIHVEDEPETGTTTMWLLDGTERVMLLGPSNDTPGGTELFWQELGDGRTLFTVTATGGSRSGIWITDGTAAGTERLADHGILIGHHNYGTFVPVVLPGASEAPADPVGPTEPESPATPDLPTLLAHDWAAEMPLFDKGFYLSKYSDVAAAGVDPLQHFMRFGAAEGRDPNSHFDVSFYLNQNPDVLAAGANALEHYMSAGWKEGRDASFGFDGDAYVKANPDVAEAGLDPLLHYLHHGEAEGRDAFQATPHATGLQNPLVDASFYYATYGDVAKEGVDATQHFMASGWMEGRDANAFFDTSWYLATYQDVAEAGVNPLNHYLQFGAGEHRAPSLAFDAGAYLAANADVAEAGMNSLKHYLQHGQFEGRDIFAA
ncbi:hypothetical protein [Teichococcus aestuarii]|uniref:Uncharacterized protein n=1 Tax=Teichococcus aestuarii TaxID=568898 RepID=A0A2U1UXI2_9PROT|nr:hypothetical protein [Pseudoroseomonas aestuarii]PWC26373.1 hypothetical protein CR165_23570 [Pseudoroseomonas aestuarii]